MPTILPVLLLLAMSQAGVQTQARAVAAPFTSPFALADMAGKQAVVETTRGTIILNLLPEKAPNHVAYFITLARQGEFNGTIFHRVIRDGIIQGGDPLSRDPAKVKEYGSGGMYRLQAESREEKHTEGSVSAVTFPGDDNSGGSQFLITVGEQPGLDGQFTVFARVAEGLEIVRAISSLDADADGLPAERVAITSVTIRDTPPEPFTTETVEELAAYRAILETPMGAIDLELLPDRAPVTVRRFLQMIAGGVYDGMAFHRVAANFVIQTGALFYRATPLLASQQRLVANLPPEFSQTPNVPGVVSMARGDDPGSGSTSFFICIGTCTALTGQYTVFARVVGGMDVVNLIAAVPVNGETPVTPVVMTRVRAVKTPQP